MHVCYIRAKTTGGRRLFLQFQSIQSHSGSTGGCASVTHSDKQCEMALTLPSNLSRRPYSSSIVIKQLSKLCKVGFSKLLWPRFGTRRAAAVHCDRLTELWPRAIFLKMDKKYFDLQLFLLVKLDVASMIFKIHVLHVTYMSMPGLNNLLDISFSFRTHFKNFYS